MENMKKPKIATLDDLFGIAPTPTSDIAEAQIQEIELTKLHEFTDHPFQIVEDESMRDMAESIKTYGQLTLAIVRPLADRPGEYELVSGNRRHRACQLAGLTHMRVIVQEMTQDEAIVRMVDANIQREHILPSERARAYKMKLDAIRRCAGRPPKKNSRQVGTNFESADIVGKDAGESGRQVQRFIRLTDLIPPLLDMVDQRRVAFNPAVELSYLSEEQQRDLVELMVQYDCTPSLSQAQRMKEAAHSGQLNREDMELVMQELKPNQREALKLSREQLRKYFPDDTPKQDIEDTIMKALEYYQKCLERQRHTREPELVR